MPTYRGKRFTDASLLGLAKIETIRQLALYDTVVTDDGLETFAAKAKRLTHFHMSSPHLTDRGLGAILANCPIANLQIHDAAGVTDASAAAIARHADIRELYLNGCTITDESARLFATMPEVWSFCANGSRITDEGLASLGKLPQLGLLQLSSTRVRGHGVRDLASRADLNLYLEDCRVNDEGIAKSLPAMRSLKLLSLSKTDVTDAGLAAIGSCRALQDLRLDDTGVTDAILPLLEELPDLQVLYVRGTRVTRDVLIPMKKRNRDMSVYASFSVYDDE